MGLAHSWREREMNDANCQVGIMIAVTVMSLLVGCDREGNATVFDLKDCESRLDAEVCGSSCQESPFEIKVIVNVDQQVVMTGIRSGGFGTDFSPSELVKGCKVATAREWVCEDSDDLGIGTFTMYLARSGNKLQRYRFVTNAPKDAFSSDRIYECGVKDRL